LIVEGERMKMFDNMTRISAWAAVLVFVVVFARAQTTEPAFAAVSIKPTTLRGYGRVELKPGGRLTAINVSVGQLVNAAYGLTGSARLARGPKCPQWIDSERFDVEAVADEGVVPGRLDDAQLRQRMEPLIQRLLAERFKLVIRREPKEMPVYTLTVAASGAKLTQAAITEAECRTTNDCHQVSGNRMQGLRGNAVNMADLAYALEASADRPVVDETGIVGLFSVQVRPFASVKPQLDDYLAALPDDRPWPPAEPPKPSVSSVLEKDFGLLLRPSRARIETIQIESVDRPSAN
jgi:uncharacterized protein (TIGR03435 family)